MRCAIPAFVAATILMFGAQTSHAYTQSLADCKAVAAKFRNTCVHNNFQKPATNVAEMASEKFFCPEKWKCIEGGTSSDEGCSWERRLCVTCRRDGLVTKIRVQTNNLPDHCVKSNGVKAQNFDYEVPFNPKKTHGTWDLTFKTQQQLNNVVCSIKKTHDVDTLGIVEHGTAESANAMGFALNGVAFQFANQIKQDPVSPILESNEQPLDVCLGHTQQNSESGMYHYHDISPCINDKFLADQTTGLGSCVDHAECGKSVVDWALSGFATMKSKTVIGIGKDGHVLYGPYDDTGALWEPVNVDACNGAWSADKQDYFYVSTRWHPYVVGCLGPSDFPHNADDKLYAQCSKNGMTEYVDTDSVSILNGDDGDNGASMPAGNIAASVCAAAIPLLM